MNTWLTPVFIGIVPQTPIYESGPLWAFDKFRRPKF